MDIKLYHVSSWETRPDYVRLLELGPLAEKGMKYVCQL